MKLFKQIYTLLPKRFLWKLLLFQFLIIFSSLVEFISVASVIPFIGILTTSSIDKQIDFSDMNLGVLNFIYNYEIDQFILVLGIIICITILFSNLLNFFVSYVVTLLGNNINLYIQLNSLKKYYSLSYEEYMRMGESRIKKNIIEEVNRIAPSIIVPLLNINARLLFIAILVSSLIYINFIATFVTIFFICLIYIFIILVIKNKLVSNGVLISNTAQNYFGILNDSLSLKKELDLFGISRYFFKQLKQQFKAHINALNLNSILGFFPKYIIESIAFIAIILTSLYAYFSFDDPQIFFPMIGFITFAAYRLIPSVQTLYNNYVLISSNYHALQVISDDQQLLRTSNKNHKKYSIKDDFQFNELEISNFDFKYTGSNQNVFENASIKLKQSKNYVIFGNSGAGKTTLINIITGLLNLKKGKITINKESFDNIPIFLKRKIGYVSQDIHMTENTLTDNILLGSRDIKHERFSKILEILEINKISKNNIFIDTINNSMKSLSGGQKKRIGISRALVRDIDILILDEVFSSLEYTTGLDIISKINKIFPNMCLLLITHDKSLFDSIENKILIKEKKIYIE